MGAKSVEFISTDAITPARFYMNCAPAHHTYPTRKITIEQASPEKLGNVENCNVRTIYKFLHPSILPTCQLSMGMTVLEPGSLWNTMPCHTHERRMEVYLYFNMKEDNVVFHYMVSLRKHATLLFVMNKPSLAQVGLFTQAWELLLIHLFGEWLGKIRCSTIWIMSP